MLEIVLRVALGIVLASAALAKLASARSSIPSLASFGIGEGPLRPLSWATLIGTELVLGVAVALGSEIAAYAAAALMVTFAALTAGALIRGRAGAPCACFGPRSTVSSLGVARNLALAAAFGLAPSVGSIAVGTEGWLAIGIGVSLVASAGLAVAVLALAREIGMLRLQLGTQSALEISGEGPDIGASVEPLAERLGIEGEGPGADPDRLGLAVFTSEGCNMCQALAPAVENVARDPRVAAAVFDEVAEAELWRTLGIPGSPYALAVDRSGVALAKGTFNSLSQLESILATAERRRSEGLGRLGVAAGSNGGSPGRLPTGA